MNELTLRGVRKDFAADIVFVKSLHNNNDGRLLRVVQTGAANLRPKPQHRFSIGRALDTGRIVRIVEDANVAADAKERPADRCSDARSAGRIRKIGFARLIRTQAEPLTPQALVPRTEDQLPARVRDHH